MPHEVDYGELPELTRALRALGSSRRHAGKTQTMFFRPLLEARRKAQDARSAIARAKAFDASELALSLDRCLERIVADAPDSRDSARRAIRAELDERVDEYRASLAELSAAARTLLAADSDNVLAAWRAWTARLERVFQCADRTWLAIQPVVDTLAAQKSR